MEPRLNAPAGTVTFLFTDIEGSTRLWERFPEAMRLALAEHDALLRQSIEDNSGYVFKTVGDAFYAAFPTAPDALRAAIDAHLGLLNHKWAETGPIRVRMGLHTGEAEVRDGDYFGQTLNRSARLQSIAYGGQTLLSQAAYELMRDRVPKFVVLKPLGLHRLKDLNRAEQVYQVMHPALPADFPPLQSLDSLPNNLPIQLTSFIGREQEMEEIKRLTAAHNLVTLLGPGGTGKTRLSLQAGADLLGNFSDGVWFIELASVSDDAMVPQAVASVLGIKEEMDRPMTQTLVANCKSRSLLLIMDNCEHLLDGCARLAQTLLQSCPRLHILASSREGFNVPGELILRVPSLQMPDPKSKFTVESLTQFEAVRLFVDRAISIKSAFTVTNESVPALAQVCTRLDGIPLAIELAAARVRSLSVQEINDRLDNRFRLLTGGSRTALPRQQTLRALIDWSYDMLAPPEKALFHQLSIFSGGWTLEAAEAVCAGEEIEPWEIFDLLTSLVDKSLVVTDQEAGCTRYRFLETIRQYSRDRLLETGEDERVRERHCSWFQQFVEETSRHLAVDEEQTTLELLTNEHDNLRAALEWALANRAATALSMAVEMGLFWFLGGYLREGREQLEHALAMAPAETPIEIEGAANFQIGRLAVAQGAYEPARSYLERSLELSRLAGNKRQTASALNSLGIVAHRNDDYTLSRRLLEESLSLHRELGYRAGIAAVLSNLGSIMQDQGDYEAARSTYIESLAIYQELTNKRGMATAILNLGDTEYTQGHIETARPLFEQSLAIGREVKDDWYAAYSLCSLAFIYKDNGDTARARALAEESLTILRRIGDRATIADCLSVLGEIACLEGEYSLAHSQLSESLTMRQELGQKRKSLDVLGSFANLAVARMNSEKVPERIAGHAVRATKLLGAAEAQRTAHGVALSPLGRSAHDARLTTIRAAIDQETFAAAWAEGEAMTKAAATAYAIQAPEPG